MTKPSAGYPPGLFSEEAAAQYISMSVTTLRGIGLPAKRFGRRKLYLRETLDAWRTEFPDRPASDAQRECAVYRYFDAQGGLLYVGIAYDFAKRHLEHRERKWWHPLIQRALVRIYASRQIAETVEAVAIDQEKPIHNLAKPTPGALSSEFLSREDPQGGGKIRVLDEITHEYETGPALSPRESLMASMVDGDE